MNCPAHKLESQRIQFNCVGVCQTLESKMFWKRITACVQRMDCWCWFNTALVLHSIELLDIGLGLCFENLLFFYFLELSNALYCIELSCITSFSNCWSGVLNAVNGHCPSQGIVLSIMQALTRFVSFGNKQLKYQQSSWVELRPKMFTFLSFLFQVRSLSSASLTTATAGLQTRATERSTRTSTQGEYTNVQIQQTKN